MLTMTATLQTATRSPKADPIATVTIADTPCERPRLDWTAVYSDATADDPHAACVTSAGHVCRIRTPAAGGAVYLQHIAPADLGTASNWSTWTDTGEVSWTYGGTVDNDANPNRVDVAPGPNAGEVIAVYSKKGGVNCNGQAMYSRSTDNGATWSAWGLVLDLGNAGYIKGLALTHDGISNPICYVAYNPGGGADQDNLIAPNYYTAGAWYPFSTNLSNRWPIDGIDARRNPAGGSDILIADGSPRQLTFVHHNASTWTWTTPEAILTTGTGAVTAPYEPRWVNPIPANARYGFTWTERSTSPAYTRACLGFSPLPTFITEYTQWEWSCNYGLALIYNPTDTYWYAIQANRALRAPSYTGASGQITTIANDRIAALTIEHDLDQPGGLDLLLDNSDGAYNALTGTKACIRLAAQLSLKLGFYTTAGLEQLTMMPLWIDAVGYEVDPGRNESWLRLHAHDAWGELAACVAKQQQLFVNKSIAHIVQRAWWRVLARAESDPIAGMSQTLPAYQVSPGTHWDAVIRRLVRSLGVCTRFRSNQATPTGFSSVEQHTTTWVGGAQQWALTTATDDLARAAYANRRGCTVYNVQALGYFAQYTDWTNTRRDLRDTTEYHDDRTMDTQAEADLRAANGWYYSYSPAQQDQLDVWPVLGLEPGDSITYTDARVGITARKGTIRHITTILERRSTSDSRNERRERTRFTQRLRLEAGV